MRIASTTHRTLAAAALAALLPACGLHGPPAVEPKAASGRALPQSRTAPPDAAAPAAVQVVAPGIVEPRGGEVELSAPEAGTIARLLVQEGERVEAGQILAVLEDAAQEEAVALAEAERDEAEAALQRAERGSTPEELRQAEAEESAALARARLARGTDERARRLRRDGASAEAEADGAAAEAEALTALAERARARLEELRRGPRAEDRRAARARVASARARVRLALAALQRRQVAAPSSGVVLRSRFHAGEYYAPGGEPLFLLGDLGRLQVRLEVDEIDSGEVSPEAACAIHSDDGLRLADGIVVRVAPRMGRRALQLESPTARSDVRVREVFVEIPAAAGLVPGQRVWGRVQRRGAAGQAAAGAPTPRGGCGAGEPIPSHAREIRMNAIAIAAAIALGAGPRAPAQLSYHDALAEALARSPDLRAARARLDQARTIGWKAWAAQLPQVTAAASWTRNEREAELPALPPLLPQPIVLQPLIGRSAQVLATLSLFAPQLWLDIRAAQAAQDQAEWSAEQARQEVLFGVAGLYHGAVAAKLAVQVAARQLAIATAHEADAEIRHQAGTTPRAALLRARIDRAAAEQTLEATRAAHDGARLALAAALDRSDAAFEVELPDEPAVPAPDEAAANPSGRADLRGAEAGWQAARRARGGLWASYLPTLGAFARSAWQDPAGLSGERRSWAAGLTLSWNLFDGTLREGRLRESAARVEETEAQLRAAELRAREQLERARLDVRTARANRARALAQVELARESQRLVDVSFREGAATYLEASDAAQQLGTAELAAIAEQLKVRLAVLRLLQALGARSPA